MSQLEHGRSVVERLNMCRNLLETHNNRQRAEGNTRAMVLVKHRAAAIRRALLGSAAAAPDLADELLSPAQASARLSSVLDGLDGKPQVERVRGALYVRGLAHVLSALTRAESRFNVTVGATDYVGLVGRADAILGVDPAGQCDHVIDGAIGGGAFGDAIRDELVSAAGASERKRRSDLSITAQLAAKFDEISREDENWRARFSALTDQIYAGTATYGDRDALKEEWFAWRKELLEPVQNAKLTMDKEVREADLSARRVVGRKIVDRLMAASGVTQEQADAWAAAQEITTQAKNRLRKIGYPIDEVRRDMAEFYRVTGGRLPGARIHSDGDKRANATNIEAHGKVGTINLGTGFDKKTLWHELGHHLEADPVAKAAAGRFIRRRSVDGGKVHSLRNMTGIRGYSPKEIALQGNFFDPYVGKVYADGATEVFSMGIETFSDPALLAKRATDDPQTLEFISGYLSAPLDELGRAHMRLRDMLREAEDDALQTLEAESVVMVAKVAAKVPFTESQDRSWMGSYDWMYRDDKSLGYFDLQSGARWWVLSGKVRTWGTRRKVAGFRVIHPSDGGGMSSHTFPSKDFDLLKVAMFKFDREGIFSGDPERLKSDSTLKGMLS